MVQLKTGRDGMSRGIKKQRQGTPEVLGVLLVTNDRIYEPLLFCGRGGDGAAKTAYLA